MSTTTSTAIQTGLGFDALGTFETNQQLQSRNDRDIFEVVLDSSTNDPTGTIAVFTEVTSAFNDIGPITLDANNRIFGDAPGLIPDLITAATGNPVRNVAAADDDVNDSIFVGVTTASSPIYNPNLFITDPGANVIFNYTSYITLLKNEWDAVTFGTTAADTIEGTDDADAIVGLAGDDFIEGGRGADEIDGGSGDDLLSGQNGADHLRGGDGKDTVFGGVGNDTIDGDDDNDLLRGGVGNDVINGGTGNDLLSGEQGNDVLRGGDGDDTANGGIGDDTVRGNDGNDLLRGLEDDDLLVGGAGDDDLRGNEGEDELRGGQGNDVLRGQNDDDIISGGADNDTVFGGQGNDTVNGDDGNDFLRGGLGDDLLSGNDGDDFLSGEAGDDTLFGLDGDDTLIGGLGSDTLDGYGFGNDPAERDVLIGGDDNISDTFVLGNSAFGGGGAGVFYSQGGDADFALLRGVEIDPAGSGSGVEDRIQLSATETYFLADVTFTVPSLGVVTGVGIYVNDSNVPLANDLIAVVENVFEADINNGINNNLFSFV